MLSSSRSSTKIGDNVTSFVNIREGMINVSNSTHISRNNSFTEAGMIASQLKDQQQSINYHNLSCETVPNSNNGYFIQAPITVAPQTGSKLSQVQTQQTSIETPSSIYGGLATSVLAAHNPSMQNFQNSQQQLPHSEIPASVSVCDQFVQQCVGAAAYFVTLAFYEFKDY